MAALGSLLSQQVERAKSRSKVVVQFSAVLPGDGSQVSVDWWLRQINEVLRDSKALRDSNVVIELEFADVDAPARLVGEEVNPIGVVKLQRKIEEMQLYIDDLDRNFEERVAESVEAKLAGLKAKSVLSDKEVAIAMIEREGCYVDAQGFKWVDIATEAKRIGQNYINLWRAATGVTKSSIQSMVVGTTNAGGDRILVKQGSFVAARKGRKK